MDLLSTGINAGVVAVVGLLVAWYTKGRFDALDRRMDRLEARVDRLEARVDGLGDRFDRRMDAFQASLDALRRDVSRSH